MKAEFQSSVTGQHLDSAVGPGLQLGEVVPAFASRCSLHLPVFWSVASDKLPPAWPEVRQRLRDATPISRRVLGEGDE